MYKVLLSFFFLSSQLLASEGLNQFLVYKKCQNENCFQLRESFQANSFSLQEESSTNVEVGTIKVVKNEESDNYAIDIEIKEDNINDLQERFLVYRHQILSSKIIKNSENKTIARVNFKKNTPLKDINKQCMKISKNCKWVSELNRY